MGELRRLTAVVLGAATMGLPLLATAMPAAPIERVVSQPDGSQLAMRQWGDRWSHGFEGADGYSVIQDEATRAWHYAIPDADGRLIPSGRQAGRDQPPAEVVPHLRPQGAAGDEVLQRKSGSAAGAARPQPAPVTSGTADIPVILINFSDTSKTYSTSSFSTQLFGSGNDSMKEYYEEISYGQFTVSSGSAGVVGWTSAGSSHDTYGRNDQRTGYDVGAAKLVIEAVTNSDSSIDFADYDQDGDCYVDTVAIIHQGSGEEYSWNSSDIWSHQWDLDSAKAYGDGTGAYTTKDSAACGKLKVNNYIIMPEIVDNGIMTIGTFAHEYGHVLGLPDFYDYDYSSNGLGRWDLMAGGAWNTTELDGDTPAHMSAWCKVFLGWATPTRVEGTLSGESISAAAESPDIYQLLEGDSDSGGEYFLIENRYQTGFDSALPGSGLAIYHVDESQISNDNECSSDSGCSGRNYWVALEQADGKWDLERAANDGDAGDLYSSATASSFGSSTTPSSDLYDGSATQVAVSNVSAAGSTMTATLSSTGDTSSGGTTIDCDVNDDGSINLRDLRLFQQVCRRGGGGRVDCDLNDDGLYTVSDSLDFLESCAGW